MKHLTFLVIALFAATAFAQAPAKPEPMKEAAKPEAAKAEPVKEAAAAPAASKSAAPKKPRRWNEDARHCLDQGSNTDIIKCAEEFL
jgi:hypothetical protein